VLEAIVNLIPEEWLQWEEVEDTAAELRDVYLQFLLTRLNHSEFFIKEAQNARENLYEYAVIRVVPRVEREEFLNVGIVILQKKPFIKYFIS
jgi:hypothetical protein